MQIGQYTDHGFAGALLEPAQTRFEQRDIAAEAIDDKAPVSYTHLDVYKRQIFVHQECCRLLGLVAEGLLRDTQRT